MPRAGSRRPKTRPILTYVNSSGHQTPSAASGGGSAASAVVNVAMARRMARAYAGPRRNAVTPFTLARSCRRIGGESDRLIGLREVRAEPGDGLQMYLAHARLGDPEDVADLRQRHTFEVVQG